ncbi:MAG TPA: protein kinase [Thermoanaerobaculia bacterium]|nr:protein kinase [Thermoanaerobaculia bacterium]
MVGRIVGSYRIVEKIGEGGMGAVYRAIDEMLEREVAIKAIRPDLSGEPQIVERFRAEAKILARVNHPAIATIYSFFEDSGDLFIAMEYVRGRRLTDVMGTLDWQRAVSLLGSALEGIEQAHRAGIVHRDLKPDNLILTPEGTLKVMDFGIARIAGGSANLTQAGLLVGTLRYIAPEQVRGETVDRRTDVYALGAVLYQMVTGRVPFDAPSDFAVLKAQLEDPPPPPVSLVPGVPAWLNRAILRALEKDPAARFQTVEEMRTFLVRQEEAPVSVASRPETADEDLPTLVLPPRSTLTGLRTRTPAPLPSPETISPKTVETDRPRLAETPAPAIVPTPPPVPPTVVAGTSYRPVEGAGWRRAALAAAGLAALLIAGFLAWRVLQPAKPVTLAAAPAQPLPVNASPSPTPAATVLPPVPEPTPALPPRREPSPSRTARPAVPKPESPPPSTSQVAEARRPEPAAPPPDSDVPDGSVRLTGDLPWAEIQQAGADLVAEGEKLVDTYGDYRNAKKDKGAELTDDDEKLKDEIAAVSDAAGKLDKRLRNNFFSRLTGNRLTSPENRIEIARRFRALSDAAGQVDRSLSQVQPTDDVRQGWKKVRKLWVRLGELLR